MHYESDAKAYDIQYEYLFGRDMLIAPVYEQDKHEWDVYLPQDEWVHLWTGEEYHGGAITVSAELGYTPAFYRKNSEFADIFEETTALCNKPKKVSNWLITETMRILKEKNMDPEDIAFSPKSLARIIELADEGSINSNVAKEIFEKIFDEDIDPDKYIEEHGLKQVNDEGALKATVEKVIADNPQSVADYRAGKEKAIGFLVGQTMKAMQGKANPGMVNKLLKELL